jgi:hypothetical protein
MSSGLVAARPWRGEGGSSAWETEMTRLLNTQKKTPRDKISKHFIR